MKGFINLNRFDTISICEKEGNVYVVFSNGRHRMGVNCRDIEAAHQMLQEVQNAYMGKYLYYVDKEMEEVRSYRSNSKPKDNGKD